MGNCIKSITYDQETILNWFGLENPDLGDVNRLNELISNIDRSAIEVSPALSLETLRLVVQGLWEKIQEGLSLADIENLIFFIAFTAINIAKDVLNINIFKIFHIV